MNKLLKSTPHNEHGTTRSYIIGFALSLLFTFLPYYLVVNKTITGTALLSTILAVAALQMLIQIFFFLHLGRGPKPLYNIVFFVGTAGTILVVVVGSIFIMRHLHYNMAPQEVTKKLAQDEGIAQVSGSRTGACQETFANHQVVISGGRVSPFHVEARLCDTLTFVNEDDDERIMTFGSHPHHEMYAGEGELTLGKERGKTITLNQSGSYQFHDHLDPTVTGDFTVTP